MLKDRRVIERDSLLNWAKRQVELETDRIENPTKHVDINTLHDKHYLEGRRAAFEKVLRIWGGRENNGE